MQSGSKIGAGLSRFRERFGMKPQEIMQQEVPSRTASQEKAPMSQSILNNPNSLMNRSKSLAAKKTAEAEKNPLYKSSKLVKPSNVKGVSSLNKFMFGAAPKDSLSDVVNKEQEQIKLKELARQKALEQAAAKKQATKSVYIDKPEGSYQTGGGISEVMSRIEKKLDSAKRKFVPSFGQKNEGVNEFQMTEAHSKEMKTPSTNATSCFIIPEEAQTPAQFKSSLTDEQGNRNSILPGSERPSLIPRSSSSSKKAPLEVPSFDASKTNELDVLKRQNEEVERKGGNKGSTIRKNFVKINQMKNYKPALRGAAFTNKRLAKKVNSVKDKMRWKKKLDLENMKARDQVNAYGGLGKVGLDYAQEDSDDEDNPQKKENEIPAFSGAGKEFAERTAKKVADQEDDEMLCAGFDVLEDELKQIDHTIEDIEVDPNDLDKAAYAIPTTDEGYRKILKERFGHEEFKEGQLEAIKILLEEKKSSLVVLATGGGKSLIYQYVTQFMPGLVLVVTPLISLMSDQLTKLPDFIPGASINSQQKFQTKQQVLQAVRDKGIKVLFITPERLFLEDLSKFQRKISMVCVDEIHCASEWSHNFRPSYLMLHDMIKEKLGPTCRVIGLTATATKSTQKEICRIFDIQYPQHLVTQNDLSRLNLQLSITRDSDKTKSLMTLLKSDSFKRLTSILLFATTRRTTEQIAAYLSSNGIQAAAYHAGKTDEQRTYIQKQFIGNQIRILCCTIAFSMGIDKSDIQSVIHYDLPRSIENYVQEIGRAGRDGKLARCHMFLNNDDFYQLRRITLSDLLDSQSGFTLTNKIICNAKRALLKVIKPEFNQERKSKKRKRVSDEDCEDDFGERIIDEFEHEEELKKYYSKTENRIRLDEIPECNGQPLYIALNTKDLCNSLDLKKEVVLTMLNQLEKIDNAFFSVTAILPASLGLRFHKESLDELAACEGEKFFEVVHKLAPKSFQGVYRVSTIELAHALQVKPYNVPRILYAIQHNGSGKMTYETDHESFILDISAIPTQSSAFQLSQAMLSATRKIESALVQKLNCSYFIARKVSLPSVDSMLNREKNCADKGKEMYLDFSQQLNKLINKYFSITTEEDMEVQIAGGEEERNIMMPLLYIGDREKASLASEIQKLLRDYHHGSKNKSWLDVNNRMKPLDVTKVLMGIMSSRENVKRFQNDNSVWARRQEYCYNEILKHAEATVQSFYLEMLPTGGAKRLNV